MYAGPYIGHSLSLAAEALCSEHAGSAIAAVRTSAGTGIRVYVAEWVTLNVVSQFSGTELSSGTCRLLYM